jgi:hypothetical protein
MWENLLRTDLKTLVELLMQHSGLKISNISKVATGDAAWIARVIGGSGFTIATYDRAIAHLSDIWPRRLRWPRHIKRPPSDVAHSAPTP